MDSVAQLRLAGRSGEAPIVPGDPGSSSWMRWITSPDPEERMPKDGPPLTSDEVFRIRSWILGGAVMEGTGGDAALAAWLPRGTGGVAPVEYRHPVPISALAFSADGAELAIGAFREVLVVDARDGAPRRRLPGLPDRITALQWSPDGAALAVAAGNPGRLGEAVLLRATDGSLRTWLRGGADSLTALRFSPDGSRIAVGGADGVVTVHDAVSGMRQLVLPAHSDWVLSLAWSGDGKRLVSASRDRTVRVADSSSGEAVSSFTEHGAAVFAAEFNEDATRVASTGKDRRLRVWEVAGSDSKTVANFGDVELTAMASVAAGVVTAGTDGVVRLHPWKSIQKPREYRAEGRATAVAGVGVGERVAGGYHDGRVRVWSTADGSRLAEFRPFPGLD
jgi:WD40 repeat protein